METARVRGRARLNDDDDGNEGKDIRAGKRDGGVVEEGEEIGEGKCISDAMGEAKRKELQGMHEGKDKGGEKQRGRKQTWTRARVANQ